MYGDGWRRQSVALNSITPSFWGQLFWPPVSCGPLWSMGHGHSMYLMVLWCWHRCRSAWWNSRNRENDRHNRYHLYIYIFVKKHIPIEINWTWWYLFPGDGWRFPTALAWHSSRTSQWWPGRNEATEPMELVNTRQNSSTHRTPRQLQLLTTLRSLTNP
jgi:hypothetical protein